MVKKQLQHINSHLQSGVTLIEMIIVVAIVAVVMSVILFNYSDFSTNVSVRNLAQEIALSIRKAQTYATSVRQISPDGTMSDAFTTYGIAFSTNDKKESTMMPNNKRFVLFADTDAQITGSGNYDAGTQCGSPTTGDECVETFSINTADKISQICWFWGSGGIHKDCTNDGYTSITFSRPNPDASFCFQEECNQGISGIEIQVQSAKGKTYSVRIWNTGQVGVVNNPE